MNPNDPLGNRLAAEARANRPAFNAQLHARVMAALPAAAEPIDGSIGRSAPPRRRVSFLRAAALVAVAVGSGVVTMSFLNDSPASSGLAGLPAVRMPLETLPREPLARPVAGPKAENSRRLLALARVRPMKMLKQFLNAPAQQPRQPEVVAQPETIETQPSIAAADLISIRVLSRAPFLDMQFNPRTGTLEAAPKN